MARKMSIWCDKCGCEIDYGAPQKRVIYNGDSNEFNYKQTTYDLCIKCVIEFNKYIKKFFEED